MRYINADEVLNKLPDDLPYKASVKRVLMQATAADVVPRAELEEAKQEADRLAVELEVPVPEIYGTIETDENGNLYTTKAQRTVCTMSLHTTATKTSFTSTLTRSGKTSASRNLQRTSKTEKENQHGKQNQHLQDQLQGVHPRADLRVLQRPLGELLSAVQRGSLRDVRA